MTTVEQSWLARVATPLLVRKLTNAGFLPDAQAGDRQALALAEEVGEFVGAYRRWSGQARRRGSRLDMELELADVVTTAYITAHYLGIDLDARIAEKCLVVLERPGREV